MLLIKAVLGGYRANQILSNPERLGTGHGVRRFLVGPDWLILGVWRPEANPPLTVKPIELERSKLGMHLVYCFHNLAAFQQSPKALQRV